MKDVIRYLLLAALALVGGGFSSHAAGAAAPKPHGIFILAADYGMAEVGCYDLHHYKTKCAPF